jgi:hypothetical protein
MDGALDIEVNRRYYGFGWSKIRPGSSPGALAGPD